jgi:hypothetical protein
VNTFTPRVHRQWDPHHPVKPRSISIAGRHSTGWLRLTWWGHCVDDRPQGRFNRAAGDPRYLVLHWHRLAVYLRTAR